MYIWPILLAALAVAAAVVTLRVRSRQHPRAVPPGAASTSATILAPAVEPGSGCAISEESAEERTARLQALRELQALAFGQSVAPPSPPTAAHDQIAERVRAALATITEKPNYAPRRPLLLPRLMQAMNSGEVSRRELASIVADDPALAGGLLRLANSPIYRVSATPIESLDRAIALLGIEGMRSLISAALLQPVFRISGGSFPQFADVTWQHTLYAAHAAQAHATQAQASGIAHADPFAAQLLALVMGMGAIVVFRVAVDEYLAGTTPPHAGAVAGLIDTEAAPVGRQIALNWGLSTRMETALADQDAPPGSVLSALGRALRVGRFLAALALLREQQRIDDAAVQAALSSTGDPAAYAGIWSKLPFRS